MLYVPHKVLTYCWEVLFHVSGWTHAVLLAFSCITLKVKEQQMTLVIQRPTHGMF